jgi:hypothetical protein
VSTPDACGFDGIRQHQVVDCIRYILAAIICPIRKGGKIGMKTKGKTVLLGLAVLFVSALVPASSFAGATVYAEGAYTATDLVVYIYADIDSSPGPLCSFGVKLTYPTSAGLTPVTGDPSMTGTDKATWYLGGHSYTDVYTESDGVTDGVILIGGKLDEGSPLAGVTGTRVLLGKVTFTHSGAAMPPAMGVALGRPTPYDNFVCTDTSKTVLDASIVWGSIAVYERGDANGDGDISTADMFTVRSLVGTTTYKVYADCNGDEDMSTADMFCVRSKI